ncbi:MULTISPECIES: Uma2 family endonuclease [Spirulina sp. CCY15215]|uniref:Uma2 family endonuclease n=1 Tax=Spirulina sp. CCY15215 TaxID=2767591 RepID=UPI00194FCEEA|nr:Uma2 family endonuclease [Spirulina major]
MVQTVSKTEPLTPFPDHTQLPDEDGTFVKNFQEHPQSLLLTDSLSSILQQLHPDGQYCIGQDCGIYWRETEPPERGAEAPDWFYVPNVPPNLDGQIRRSYVIWREHISPTIVLEFASGDGSEERDRTPLSRSSEGDLIKPGKFWVYEQIMRIAYYGIFIVTTGELEMYQLVGDRYEPMTPGDRGHYAIIPMQVELGVWEGIYQNQSQQWLRWWDVDGNLLPIGQELAQQERLEKERERLEKERERSEKEQERSEKEQERQKRLKLVEKLRSLSPEQLEALGINANDLI